MRRPGPLPARLSRGPFRTRDALVDGVPKGRLRRRDVEHPFHGVNARDGSTTTLADRARAYAVTLSGDAYFSHITAARLLGMRLPLPRHGEPLHVTVVGSRARSGSGVRGHRSDAPPPLLRIEGLPVPHAAEVWASLGAVLTVDELIVAGDGLLRRRSPLCTLGDLRGATERYAGRRGCRSLTAALPHLRAGTDSARETILRLLLVRAGLPEPEVNGAIRNEHGVVIAHADLLYRDQKVVVEYDGRHHLTDLRQWNIDIDRLDEVMALGYRVLRVTAELLDRRATLVGRVRDALER